MDSFSSTLDWALRMILLIGLPSAIALFMLAEPLLVTLFGYGSMTERDIVMAGQSLRAYSCGLLAFMLIKVLAPGYFARQDMKTPVRIAIQAMVANMLFDSDLPVCSCWSGGGDIDVGIFECRAAAVWVAENWCI